MIFHVGIENKNEGFRSIAWALEHPGCFVYGSGEADALARLPGAIRAYADWIALHESSWIVDSKTIDLKVEDVFSAYCVDESFERVANSDNEINAWFQDDWKSLAGQDIERGLKLLSWARMDLLETIKGLSFAQLEQTYPNEKWNINGILNHIGAGERWYMDRLGKAFPRSELPQEPMARLEKVRAHLIGLLPSLEGSKQVIGIDGEFWSPRKMLRRAVWHERDHMIHIQKLL
jgi:hypothetical protein